MTSERASRPPEPQVNSQPVRLVQCQLETDHYTGVERALAERGIGSERVFPDQPPPEMGRRTKAVVISDPFASMNALAWRQARRVGAAVILVMDGIVEYRNTFLNPRVDGVLAHGDSPMAHFLRPAPADFVACCGEIDRRILAALGNQSVATGLPRLAAAAQAGPLPDRRAVMIATANQPFFSDEERGRLVESLRALKAAADDASIDIVWRLRADLDEALGVRSDPRRLRDALADVRAVITTPSTLLVESMLAGRATAVLHPHPTPLWQPAAWGWRGTAASGDSFEQAPLSGLAAPAQRALLSLHDEARAMTAWYDGAGELLESILHSDAAMLERQLACLNLLFAATPAAGGRGAASARLAGMLESVCAGDLTRCAETPPFPSFVRAARPRTRVSRPCVVSCVVCDDTPVGGVLTWSERLGDAFAARDLGFDVRTLLVCVKPDAWRTSGARVTTSERVDLCVIDPMADHARSLAQVRRSIEHLAGGVPAIVIPNYTDITYAAAAQLRAAGARTLVVAHTDEPYYKELASTYTGFDGAVGVSRECLAWLSEIELGTREPGASARPLECIPCLAPVASRPRPVGAEGPLRIAYVGRMVQVQKRIFDLLKVIDGLEERGVAYELHMVGDGVDLPRWRAELGTRTLARGRVILHGRREPRWVEGFMSSVDVSVLVSEFEGTSVSMLEAMGAGVVPAVTSVRSGVGEWVADGQTGVVVPVGRPDIMAERLAALANDHDQLARLGRAAWEKARRDGSVERMAEAYRVLFDRIVKRPLQRGPSDLGARLIERWRWSKDWVEHPEETHAEIRRVLTEAGYRSIVNDAPLPGCDAVIVRTAERPLSRVQAEQVELWRACGLGVVVSPHLRARGVEDAMSPVEARTSARARELIERAAADGCSRIAVYGTGKHTRRLGALFDGVLPVVGFIDDAPPAWEYMFGLPIAGFDNALAALNPDAVLLSSDAWESSMWERTAAWRRAGIRVIPIYGEYVDEEAPAARAVAA